MSSNRDDQIIQLDEEEECLGGTIKDATNPKTGFRIQAVRYLLTYKTHLPKDAMGYFFARQTKRVPEDIKCIVAHEKASSKTNYEHTHIFLDCGKAFNSRNVRVFDFNGIHPNIKSILTKTYDRVLAYISKEDPELAELHQRYDSGNGYVTKIWESTNMTEALRSNVNSASEANGVIAIFKSKPPPPINIMLPEEHLYHVWQRALWIKMLRYKDWDYRCVMWMYDPACGRGKSRYAACWDSNYGACILTNISGQKDTATSIETEIEKGWNQQVIFCDFPFGEQDHKIYTSLEVMINGKLTVTKYKSRPLYIQPKNGARAPMVIVMANWLPNYAGRDRLAEDRYCVWHIHEDGTFTEMPNQKRMNRLAAEKAESERPNVWTLAALEATAMQSDFSPTRHNLDTYTMSIEPGYSYNDRDNKPNSADDVSKLDDAHTKTSENMEKHGHAHPVYEHVITYRTDTQDDGTSEISATPSYIPDESGKARLIRDIHPKDEPAGMYNIGIPAYRVSPIATSYSGYMPGPTSSSSIDNTYAHPEDTHENSNVPSTPVPTATSYNAYKPPEYIETPSGTNYTPPNAQYDVQSVQYTPVTRWMPPNATPNFTNSPTTQNTQNAYTRSYTPPTVTPPTVSTVWTPHNPTLQNHQNEQYELVTVTNTASYVPPTQSNTQRYIPPATPTSTTQTQFVSRYTPSKGYIPTFQPSPSHHYSNAK